MNSVSNLFWIRSLILSLLSSFVLIFFAGCDTIARIPFPQRSLEEINSSGFISPSGTCGGTNGDTGEMKLRFALADESNEPIWPGEELGEDSVEMTADSLTFSNSSIYEGANGVCGGDGDCQASDFSCAAPPDNQEQPPRRCIASTNLSANDVSFVSKDAPQFFGVVMENSGSFQGWIPNDLAIQDHYDYCTETSDGTCECENSDQPCTPDGTTDSPGLDSQVSKIATDGQLSRIAQLKRMETALSSVAQKARREDGRETFFGAWSFSNQNQPKAYLEDSEGWTSNLVGEGETQFNKAVSELESSAGSVNQTRANTYEATKQVIDNYYGDSHLQQFISGAQTSPEKSLVLVVDGPDDLRDSDATTIDDLVTAATEANIRVFVIHLDPTMPNPRLLRDDPTYYASQDTCSSNDECKNFERCRKPGRYGPEDSSVEEPEVPSPDAKYCLPSRGPDGRIGPIDDLSRLACETGGGYMYLTNTDVEKRRQATNGLVQLRWMPYVIDGLWEASVGSERLRRNNVPGGTFVRVGTQLQLSVAGQGQTYSFSQGGSVSADRSVDTRSVVKTK